MINAERLSTSPVWGDRSQSLSGYTVFCDFDGPIMDVSERYYSTYQLGLDAVRQHYANLGRPLALSPLSREQFWKMKTARTPDVEIAMRSGLVQEQVAWFLDCVQQIVNEASLLDRDCLQPGVSWALNLLHTHGARLVLVTLRQQQQVIQLLREHDLSHLFSSVWGASDHQAAYNNHAHHKTDLLGKAIAHTQQRYGFNNCRACMIGDTEADVIAGQTHSITTVALTCGIRSQTYLEQFEPTLMHSDLLAIAHRLIQHPHLVDRGFDRPQPSVG